MMKKFTNLLKKGEGDDFMLPKMLDPDDIEKYYVWVTEFDDANLKTFYNSFMRLERDPAVKVIPIIISSYGGSVDVLSAMRDLIKSSPKPVSTIVIGRAMSCGVALTASGTKGMRFASEGARIMIHEISAGAWGKNSDIQVTADESKRLNKLFITNLAEDMGKSYDWIVAELHKRKNTDWFITPAQAKTLRIIDHIGIPRINHTVPETIMHVPDSYNVLLAQQKAFMAAAQDPKKRR
jgi:ATP-dependent Clp protease protease subunit